MTTYIINISDSALLHLCLIGLESYCVPRSPKETYGLLWGNSSTDQNRAVHYQVDVVSTDIEAVRTTDSVDYCQRSLQLKEQIIKECWPSLSFLGDFHTHPYKTQKEARGGYQLSDDDRRDVEEANRLFWFNAGLKINLVMSLHPLGTVGWQEPGRVNNRTNTVKWTLRNYTSKKFYRLRLSAYVVSAVKDGRRYSLIVSPRERSWDRRWMISRKIRAPNHKLYLNIPSIIGNPNFTRERWG